MIRMNNERFSVPELLFHPSDVGIQEMGVSEAVMHSVSLVQEGMMYYVDCVCLIFVYLSDMCSWKLFQTNALITCTGILSTKTAG